jgi:hypothetical protein
MKMETVHSSESPINPARGFTVGILTSIIGCRMTFSCLKESNQ